jgi:chromosome segregation ATPase
MNEEKIEEILKRRDEAMQQYIAGLIEESDRKTGALSEEFQGRLSVVAEGVVGLSEKFDFLQEKVDVLKENVDVLKENVDVLKENVDSLNVKVDHMEGTLKEVVHTQKIHTEMIGGLMESNSEVKIELENKADKKEFIELKEIVLAMS